MANHSFIGSLTSWLSEQHSNFFTPNIFLPTDVTCTFLNFDEKVSEILVGCNEGKVIIICVICFSILKKHDLSSNSKIFIKFSSLLMWMMLPKVFYLLALQMLYF